MRSSLRLEEAQRCSRRTVHLSLDVQPPTRAHECMGGSSQRLRDRGATPSLAPCCGGSGGVKATSLPNEMLDVTYLPLGWFLGESLSRRGRASIAARPLSITWQCLSRRFVRLRRVCRPPFSRPNLSESPAAQAPPALPTQPPCRCPSTCGSLTAPLSL